MVESAPMASHRLGPPNGRQSSRYLPMPAESTSLLANMGRLPQYMPMPPMQAEAAPQSTNGQLVSESSHNPDDLRCIISHPCRDVPIFACVRPNEASLCGAVICCGQDHSPCGMLCCLLYVLVAVLAPSES